MSFIAGQYTVTLGGFTVGQIEQGVTLTHSFFKQTIVGDNFGQAVQEGIFQGADVGVDYRLMEYDAASTRLAFWPYGTSWLSVTTVVGERDVADGNVSQLILTALAGTPAATSPATITTPNTIIREGASVSVLLDPSLRVIPINQRIYPNASNVYGTLT